jgi:ribonuclease HI
MQINCDGGSRGNPGPAAFGFVIKKDGTTIKEGYGYIGIATNNFAEYTALIEALKWLSKNTPSESLEFNLDSQLVVSQLTGIYKVKNADIKKLVLVVKELESKFKTISYKHIPREQNKEADALVNIALDCL